MKKQFLKIIDFLIFIFSFLLLLSTYFKLLSITFSNNEDNFIVLLWIVAFVLQVNLLVLYIRRFLHFGCQWNVGCRCII